MPLLLLGCRAQRWSLHHSLQLFERLLRQSITISSSLDATSNGGAVAAAGLGMAQAGQPGPTQQHPFTQHMEWVLVPITKIIRCGMEPAAVRGVRMPCSEQPCLLTPCIQSLADSCQQTQACGLVT
jgi:hypothetical protein